SPVRLIQVIQGAAAVTVVLNLVALWKQEARDPSRNRSVVRPPFREAWRRLCRQGRAT
ncbi:MAG TPA: MFS transporter, partial [Halieaceae bacterium]|nr:MFS transporter [Halieaceae bacterium]